MADGLFRTNTAAGMPDNRKTYNQKGTVNMEQSFKESFDAVQGRVHRNARAKGWHDKEPRNNAELIALMHSELSEGLEFLRHGNPASDHIPDFTGIEEELADVVIRIMDMAQLRGYRLSDAILAKIEFNATRPHRHGGKKF
jgi:NTP pyrophosphatase (non-canonical NTP hydrolase)